MENLSRRKLLIKYLVPSILSFLSIFLFTVVDGIFVGQGVGDDGLGAINIAFPFILFFTAFMMLVTIGGLTITAIRVGRGDSKGANEVFMHSFVLALAVTVIFTLVGSFFTDTVSTLLGANETYLRMTSDYIFWYGVFFIPCGMCTLFNGFVRNDGRPGLITIATIIATSLNIFGDWLFIFPLQMGLKGAAIATGISQTVAMFIVLPHFLKKKGNLSFHKFRFSWRLTGKILVRGIPECIAQFCTPVTTVISNIILVGQMGEAAENAYSIICYVACFAIAMSSGTAEGLQPLFGQSYGAGNESNLKFFRRIGLIIGTVGAALITVAVILLSDVFCVLYAANEATAAVTKSCMGIYAWGYAIQAVTLITSSYLYSTTRTKYAILINVLRSFIINSGITILLPAIFGTQAFWATFAVYEGIMAVISLIVTAVADRHGAIGKALE